MPLEIVILAAGQGKRMRSQLPKILHPLAGRPLLGHVLAAARALAPHRIIVVHGNGAEQVRAPSRTRRSNGCFRPSSSAPATPCSRPCRISRQRARCSFFTPTCRSCVRPRSSACGDGARRGRGDDGESLPSRAATAASCASPPVTSRASSSTRTPRTTSWPSARSTPGSWRWARAGWRAWLARITNSNSQKEYYLTGRGRPGVGDRVPVEPRSRDEVLGQVAGVSSRGVAELERRYQRMQAERCSPTPSRSPTRRASTCAASSCGPTSRST